ncbi:hypothetical protein OH687_05205 [Burkholderia anthina]|nr:hypothetical protein OH687_05205 [Burkholderia anthina]
MHRATGAMPGRRNVRLSRNGLSSSSVTATAPPRSHGRAIRLPILRRCVGTAGHPHAHLAFFAFCLVFLVTVFSQISA